MHRFFLADTQLQVGKNVEIPATEATHLQKSLRLKAGDTVELFNNHHQLVLARLDTVSSQRTSATVVELIEITADLPTVHLFVGTLKQAQLNELILQKAVELNAASINFIVTDFTQQQGVSQLKFKQERLQKIIIEACKQAERSTIPELTIGNHLAEADLSQGTTLMATLPRQTKLPVTNMGKLINNSESLSRVNLLIGPEGGFSPQEHELADKQGWQLVTLGADLILRTETAAIACLGIVQAELRQH